MNNLPPCLSDIRWQDIVDILLNSYILFRLYVLLRGTNVFRVIAGVILLWFCQRIAVSAGLIVTSWVIQGITAVAAIIIIVVFRNEIRSVLQVKHIWHFLWGFPYKGDIHTPVETIAESLYELAEKYTGALVILPGREDLQDVVQNGIPWEGRVSKEMIASIFWHGNPVHDGAAVIKGHRVSEVGAILPLSTQKDLPSYYGTRHRAALGVSETSDALVLVVSEERGNVVAARNGGLRPVYGKAELMQLIREHQGIPDTKRRFFRPENIEITLAALLSFFCITGIWYSFARGLDTMITVEAPIEYMNRGPDMKIVDTSHASVHLHLSGAAALIRQMRQEQVHVRIDLGKADIGKNSFSLNLDNITLPPGIMLQRVSPPVVEAILDIITLKALAVQADWSGKLSEKILIEQVHLQPSTIKIMGGSLLLENISTIYTEKVSLDAIGKSGKIRVKPAINPLLFSVVPDTPETIVLEYIVKERE